MLTEIDSFARGGSSVPKSFNLYKIRNLCQCRDFLTLNGAEDLIRINSSPAGAAGGEDLI